MSLIWCSLLLCLFIATPASSQEVIKNVQYGTTSAQVLDLYPSPNVSSPILVIIHGGAWYGGSKDDHADLARYYQANGYAIVSIDYRVTWQATFPANSQDVACAIAYVRKNASTLRGDPSKVALLGYSAGGHLAALHSLTGAKYNVCDPEIDVSVNAVIGVSGLYAFNHYPTWEPNRLHQMLGDTAKFKQEAEPISQLDSLKWTKYLLLTAVPDYLAPERNAYDLHDSIAARGKSVQLREFFAKDHLTMLSEVSVSDSVITAIDEFLEELWGKRYVEGYTVEHMVDIHFDGQSIRVTSQHDGRLLIFDVLGRMVNEYFFSKGTSYHYLWQVPIGCYLVSVIENKHRTTVRVILD